MGLFSLTAFVCEQRRKEIGIRKVMGAAVTQITLMLSREFLTLVLIAVLFALPIGYWATSKWLQNFAYKIDIRAWDFAIAGSMVLLIAFVTVSFHAIKSAIANPVEALRNE
jgi:putative ABC transport system permease protein